MQTPNFILSAERVAILMSQCRMVSHPVGSDAGYTHIHTYSTNHMNSHSSSYAHNVLTHAHMPKTVLWAVSHNSLGLSTLLLGPGVRLGDVAVVLQDFCFIIQRQTESPLPFLIQETLGQSDTKLLIQRWVLSCRLVA